MDNRVYGWKIKPTKESRLSKAIGGAKGVIVPHKLVDAIGDIMIISKAAIPTKGNEDIEGIS
jgi:sporulation protein YlmC with PRC-barrel domain